MYITSVSEEGARFEVREPYKGPSEGTTEESICTGYSRGCASILEAWI